MFSTLQKVPLEEQEVHPSETTSAEKICREEQNVVPSPVFSKSYWSDEQTFEQNDQFAGKNDDEEEKEVCRL